MDLLEIVEAFSKLNERQRAIIAATDSQAVEFFSQLDGLPKMMSAHPELNDGLSIKIQPTIEKATANDLTWTRSLYVGNWIIDFIYARQARYSDMGLAKGQDVRLCTRLVGLQYDGTRTKTRIVSPRLVVNFFKNNWAAQIDPFSKFKKEMSGKEYDLDDLLPSFLEMALFRNKFHPDLNWPSPEDMIPMPVKGPVEEFETQVEKIEEDTLYGGTTLGFTASLDKS